MPLTVCLNVVRHPALRVPREAQTYDQVVDRAWWAAADDIDPELAPTQIAALIPRLVLDPDRPLLIRHSPRVRTRKAAQLLAAVLEPGGPITLLTEPALAEPDIDFARAYTRTEFEHPQRPGLPRMLAAIFNEELSVVSWGRRVMARHTGTLRQSLESGGPANHLWVSHNLVMPFLYLGVVEQLPAERWTLERAAQVGPYGYAEGFHLRVTLGERATAP